jgi:DNA repair protein RadC
MSEGLPVVRGLGGPAEPAGPAGPSKEDPRPRTVMRMREMAPSERPRERLARLGARSLSAVELLALVIGSGGRRSSAMDLAHDALARSGGSLRRMAAAPVGALTAVPGIGVARAAVLHAALELGRRLAAEARDEGRPIRSPRDIYDIFAPGLEDLPVEEFHVAALDTQFRLERGIPVSRGLLSASLVHPREVFREAIAQQAAVIVVVHNHPSGDPTPSPDDVKITRQLVAAGRLLDIPVHDHVIIGRGRYVSFLESGLL